MFVAPVHIHTDCKDSYYYAVDFAERYGALPAHIALYTIYITWMLFGLTDAS